MSLQAGEEKENCINVLLTSSIEKSVSFWETIIDLTDITTLNYHVSFLKKDFEFYIPLIIKNNPKLKILNFYMDELKMDLEFDKRPLMDSLKDKELKEVGLYPDSSIEVKHNLLMESICDCFQFACIHTFILYGFYITSQNLKFLSTMKSLSLLVIALCLFDEEAKFDYSFSIKSLLLSNLTHESENGIYNFLKSNKGLEELSLSDLDFYFDLKVVKDSFQGEHLKTFVSSQKYKHFEDFVDVVKNVQYQLRIDGVDECSMNNFPLFKNLKSKNSLQKITLFESIHDLEGIDDFISKNNSLKDLTLHRYTLRNIDIELLMKGLSNNESIKILDLQFTITKDYMSDLMKSLLNGNLEYLNLNNCKIDDTSCDSIGLYLSKNFSLKKLDLYSNQIQDEGLIKLLNGLKTNIGLKTLVLLNNKFGNDGCLALKEYLKLNTSLTDLNIRNCQYDIKGLELIFEGLQYNTKLKKIELNEFDNASQILDILFFNTGLHFCNLKESKFITLRNQKMTTTICLDKIHFLNLQFLFE